MRAIVLTQLGKLELQDRPVPEPGRDGVVIRVAYTGICGSDIHGYTGENGRRVPGQVMGHESVGRVHAVGADVTDVSIGQVVTLNPVVVPVDEVETYRGREQHCPDKTVVGVAPEIAAAFADYVVVPARNVVVLADEMPLAHGALVEPLAVALHGVRRIGAHSGQRALVIGGGPIGQSVILAMQLEGVDDIFVSEPDTARLALCARLGATPLTGPLVEHLTAHGGLADIAVDAVGISPTLRDAIEGTSLGGRVCLVGMGAPRIELDAYTVSTAERTIVGSFTYSAQDFADAAAAVSAGQRDFGILISRKVTPDEADDAFSALAAGDGTAGKVLVAFDERPAE